MKPGSEQNRFSMIMRGKRLALASFLAVVSLTTLAAQKSSPARPAIINTTYVSTEADGPDFGSPTLHLYEGNGKLTLDVKWKNGAQDSTSVEYEKVNFIGVGPDVLNTEPPFARIEDSDGAVITITLHSKDEAQEVAEYVASKSAFHLEHIGWAWRIRRHFECPEAAGPGCRDFEELLDHDDTEIVDYFYLQDKITRTYGCFDDGEPRFFIVQHSHAGEFGTFLYQEFENQQSGRGEADQIRWVGGYQGGDWVGDFGRLMESSLDLKPGAKPEARGTTDAASLSYQTKYPNRENTTTQYELSVRWSTGRFTESFSGKGRDGEPWNVDKSGVCVKLN